MKNVSKFIAYEINIDSVYGGGGVLSTSSGTVLLSSNNSIWARGGKLDQMLEPDTSIARYMLERTDHGQYRLEHLNNQLNSQNK